MIMAATLRLKNKVTVLILIILSLILLSSYYQFDTAQLWWMHQTLELVSIFVAILTASTIFRRTDGSKIPFRNNILFGFTAVALVDYIHVLTFPGMPEFIIGSSIEQGRFFGLVARVIEFSTLLSIALTLEFLGKKQWWFCAAWVIVAAIAYLGMNDVSFLLDTPPFITRVMVFKVNYEYALFIGNSVLAIIFFMQYRKKQLIQYVYFAGSCFFMSLCAITFSNYLIISDYMVLIGHIFKIISAMFIYAAIYLTELERPYFLADQAVKKKLKTEKELKTTFANIPLGIIRFDCTFNYLFINPFLLTISALFNRCSIGGNIKDSLPADKAQYLIDSLQPVFTGEKVEFHMQFKEASGEITYLELIGVPDNKSTDDDNIDTILCLVVNSTERKCSELKQIKAQQDKWKLSQALDEHAIVAYTDSKGVITSVNSKFCEISQYTKEELIGKTHKVINSTYHPHSFFKNMWQTISSGKVWHGEVCNKAKDGSLYWVNTTIVPFLNGEKKPVEYIAIRADITERMVAEKEVQRLANYDKLTSLPNRRLLKLTLDKLLVSASESSPIIHGLLLIDLDNFKEINDSLGHGVGDELLKEVGSRLQKYTNEHLTASRLGGDEFTIVVKNIAETKEDATPQIYELADVIKSSLSAPYILEGQTIRTTPSIGITLFDSSVRGGSDILKQADIAMYASKRNGKNLVSFFDPELQAALDARNTMLHELKSALVNNEFFLHFQPIYNKDKKIVEVETLIRWENKVLGRVSPGEFIPLAEQSNFIILLGDWVLDSAFHQLHLWSLEALTSQWSIAINISANQIQEDNFAQKIIALLKKHRVNPRHIKLELTESMLHQNVEKTITTMKKLCDLGIRFSLDDFGTGFSSLSYLTKLPIDTLKIDQSFVNKMIHSKEDAAVVQMILSLSQNLKLNVVAEGVETQEQFDFLIDAGCMNFQGYLLSKPTFAEKLLY